MPVRPRPSRLTCLICGREIDVRPHGRLPRYCSDACRQRGYLQRQAKVEAIKPTLLQDEIRRVVWAVLIEAGLVSKVGARAIVHATASRRQPPR